MISSTVTLHVELGHILTLKNANADSTLFLLGLKQACILQS